jgi:hypothetical protein
MRLKSCLGGSQTNVGNPILPKIEFNLIPRIVNRWIKNQISHSFLPLRPHALQLVLREILAIL